MFPHKQEPVQDNSEKGDITNVRGGRAVSRAWVCELHPWPDVSAAAGVGNRDVRLRRATAHQQQTATPTATPTREETIGARPQISSKKPMSHATPKRHHRPNPPAKRQDKLESENLSRCRPREQARPKRAPLPLCPSSYITKR